jgi:hypothetical protein
MNIRVNSKRNPNFRPDLVAKELKIQPFVWAIKLAHFLQDSLQRWHCPCLAMTHISTLCRKAPPRSTIAAVHRAASELPESVRI